MNKEIREKLNNQLPTLKSKYHVKKMGVFGSFAKGEQSKGSDIDILVEFDLPIGFFDFIRLENYLSKTLHIKVDLVSKKALKPAIKKDILKEVTYV
ncbi:MAG TPA: nucleotidyltransferase [Candidatus Wolfebacteria bacterium]|nr:nucleotidyltransferase [Candidatus Wolfebacteria bacterium]